LISLFSATHRGRVTELCSRCDQYMHLGCRVSG
jgi:hypothetical protein